MSVDTILWRVFGSLFALAALSMGTLHVVVRLAHEQENIVREFTDIEGLTTLRVAVNDGRVNIVGRPTDSIRLTGTIDHGLTRTTHREVIVGDQIAITTRCNHFLSDFCTVDYTLEVPQDLDVVVRSSNGTAIVSGMLGDIDATTDNGRVQVDGAVGTLHLDSDNGSVNATNLRSRTVDASTDNGGVHLTFTDAPTSVAADSDNGSVEVVLPDLPDVTYDVQTHTDNGSVSNTVRSDPNSDRLIIGTTDNGSVTIRY